MRYKKDTRFTYARDAVRLFFAVNFYFVDELLGLEFELETEYVVLASILLFGPFFCGFACPFGAASYFMDRLRNALVPKLRWEIPQPWDTRLRYTRYALLAFFLYLFTVKGVSYFGEHMDMYHSTAFSSFFIEIKHYAVLLVAFFIPFFFCKYMCFQKAGYILMNRLVRITQIRRDPEVCIDCKQCDKVCPMQVEPSTRTRIAGGDCLSCYNCLDGACPKKAQALSLTVAGQKISYPVFSLLALFVYLAATCWLLFVAGLGE